MSVVVLAGLSGADAFGLAASALVFAYLLYALLRGEKL
jgi:hypothetical protein